MQSTQAGLCCCAESHYVSCICVKTVSSAFTGSDFSSLLSSVFWSSASRMFTSQTQPAGNTTATVTTVFVLATLSECTEM